MEREILEQVIYNLEQEHSDLHEMLDNPISLKSLSVFNLQRLKKRKLVVKDKIKILKSRLYPNIIA
jgi:hypothetical protein